MLTTGREVIDMPATMPFLAEIGKLLNGATGEARQKGASYILRSPRPGKAPVSGESQNEADLVK